MRNFDWERRFATIEIRNPKSDSSVIAPGESLVIFDGSKNHAMTGSSLISTALLSSSQSVYRLSVTGDAGFRQLRAITSVVNCAVTINNNAIAVFDFTGSTLTGVVVGDTMRIKGSSLNDTAPFKFSSLNSGLWKIIGVAGTKVTCVRFPNTAFVGATESVTAVSGDVMIYSASGVQVGDKISITGTLSPVANRTYTLSAVTPNSVDFVSTVALPSETDLAYVSGTIAFYINAKKLLYIESDQDAVVRLDSDTGNGVKINPMQAGQPCLVGYFHKWGDTYRCEVINTSVNTLNLTWISGE
jgi:hypothetical protein